MVLYPVYPGSRRITKLAKYLRENPVRRGMFAPRKYFVAAA